LRIDLAQFRELAAFSQFGSDLDKATQDQLERGRRLTEILKQPQYKPMDVEDQVLIIWTISNGYGDNIPTEDLNRMEAEFLAFVKSAHPAVLNTLREKKAIDDDLTALIRQAIEDFKATRWESYQAETETAKAAA
jgi:F-type H+-transporting ATPase subunit alpha